MRMTISVLAGLLLAWGAASGQWLERVISLRDTIDAVDIAFAIVHVPDYNVVYVAGDDGIVVFSGEDEQKLAELEIESWLLFYNPVSCRVYAGARHSIEVIDPATHRVVGSIPIELRVNDWEGAQPFAFDSARSRLYVVTGRGDIAYIDCGRDSLLRIVRLLDSSEAFSIVFSPLSRKLYCPYDGSPDGIAVVDVDSGQQVATLIESDISARGLVHCPSGDKVYVGTWHGCHVIDCETDSIVSYIGGVFDEGFHCAERNSVYFLDDGSEYLVRIDCGTDTIVSYLELGGDDLVTSLYAPTLGKLYVIPWEEYTVLVVDLAAESVCAKIRVGEQDDRPPMAFNEESGKLYCVNTGSGTVSVIDTRKDEVVAHVVTTGDGRLNEICLVPEGRRVYSLCEHTGAVYSIDGTGLSRRGTWIAAVEPHSLVSLEGRAFTLDRGHLVIISPKADTVVGRRSNGRLASQSGILGVDRAAGRIFLPGREPPGGVVYDAKADSFVASFGIYGQTSFAVDTGSGRIYFTKQTLVIAVDGATGATLDTFQTNRRLYKAAFCPSRNSLFCEMYLDSILVLHCKTGEVTAVFPAPSMRGEIVWGPGMRKFYYRTALDSLAVVDCDRFTASSVMRLGPGPRMLVCDTIRNKLYISCSGAGNVWVVGCETDSLITVVDVPGHPEHMVWSAGESRVYVTSPDIMSVSVIADNDEYPKAKREVHPSKARPTVAQGNLIWKDRLAPALLDITGRRVTELQPGNNEISSVSPGVYFVYREGVAITTKIVVQR